MIRRITILICVLLMISCEKDESIDLLTNGTWILKSELPYVLPDESIKFNSDGTFVQERSLQNHSLPGESETVFSTFVSKVKLSGDWSLMNKTIQFDHPVVSLPENNTLPGDTTLVNGTYEIHITPGEPIGSYYGYRYLDSLNNDPIYGNNTDSLKLILDGDTLIYTVISDSIVSVPGSNQWSWSIVKLTENSLVVESNGKTYSYYNR